MQAGRPNVAAACRTDRLAAAVRILTCGGLLALAVLLSPRAGQADPASQLTVAQSGVRLRLGTFVLGVNWVTMTVIVENERDDPVWLAALAGRDDEDAARAVLSDEHGKSCKAAANPGGIAEIPALPAAKPTPSQAAMTEVPAHSGMNVLLEFPHCRLSRTSLLALAAAFGLSTDGRGIELFPATFFGIVQKTRMR